MADIISRITLGHAMRAQALPQDDEEWRKQITTWVDIGLSMLFIDNIPVAHILSSGALASALTAEWWQDRMLGTNRLVTGPIGWRWFITGNNLMLSSELADRAVMIRMAAGVAHPELRSDFKHHDLTAWIDEHRPELVWACLTLVRNWVVKGCPKDTS